MTNNPPILDEDNPTLDEGMLLDYVTGQPVKDTPNTTTAVMVTDRPG